MTFVIYEWEAWSQFKLVRAVPEAVRITARPGEHAEEVLARCPPTMAAFAFHINSTFSSEFPHDRRGLVTALQVKGVAIINAAVVDISKHWVQDRCAAFGLPVAATTADGDPDERVIVKTNHNFGGHAERLLTPQQLTAMHIPRPSGEVATPRAYRVLPRCEVPAAWWIDPELAIERYISNRKDVIYRVSFAGNHVDLLRLINTHAIKKVYDSAEQTTVYSTRSQIRNGLGPTIEPGVCHAIATFVDAAEMDFGGLDIIPDDEGRGYILDVNATPYGSLNSLRRLMGMRRGLFEVVAARASGSGRRRYPLGRGLVPTGRLLVGEVRRLRAEAAMQRRKAHGEVPSEADHPN